MSEEPDELENMSEEPDELENTTQIVKERNVSGELFDLSVPTFNNLFGKETIEYAIKYGTASPLTKYINELTNILETTSRSSAKKDKYIDDKEPKRKMRLNFLHYCNGNIYIRTLFQLFMAYLNGGGSKGNRRFDLEQYKNQLHLVTYLG